MCSYLNSTVVSLCQERPISKNIYVVPFDKQRSSKGVTCSFQISGKGVNNSCLNKAPLGEHITDTFSIN